MLGGYRSWFGFWLGGFGGIVPTAQLVVLRPVRFHGPVKIPVGP